MTRSGRLIATITLDDGGRIDIEGTATYTPAPVVEEPPDPDPPDPVDPTPIDPARPTRYIGPQPTGDGSGGSPDNQATLADINRLIAGAGPGGQVLIARHQGDYNVSSPITLTESGEETRPVSLIGVDADLQPAGDVPEGAFVGTRKGADWQPWAEQPADIHELAGRLRVDASGWGGNTLFRLGATRGLEFRSLLARRFGNTIEAQGSRYIALTDFTFENVRNGVYTDSNSTASSWRMYGTTARGFSKEVLRFRGKCSHFYVQDPQWDSMAQDLDAHARGLYADDYAYGLLIEGGIHRPGFVRNCIYSKKDSNQFRQGDLLTSERYNYDVTVSGLSLSGCTDRAIDMKSNDTVLENLTISQCKRSIGVWGGNNGTPIKIRNIVSIDPTDIFELVDYDPNTRIGREVHFTRHLWFGSLYSQPRSKTEIDGLALIGGYEGMAVLEGYSIGPGGDVVIRNLDDSRLPANVRLTGGSKFTFDIQRSAA